jgi:hypothetical protein
MVPKHEEVRNRREREFQTRVLAAVEKQKPTKLERFTKFINAPAFLWFLTAIVLATFANYYTSYRQCMADSEALIERYHKVKFELAFRSIELAGRITASGSIDSLSEIQKTIPYKNYDFKDRSLFEVLTQYLHLRYAKLDFSREKYPNDYEDFGSFLMRAPFFPSLVLGAAFDKSDQNNMANLKKFALNLIHNTSQTAVYDAMSHFESACSVKTIAQIVLGGSPKIVIVSGDMPPTMPRINQSQ